MDLQYIVFSYVHSAGADINAINDHFEHQISQVVDKHAQIKRRKKLPCMNGNLKKAILSKKKFVNEYQK